MAAIMRLRPAAEVSGYRSAVHFILFLLCLYFGLIKAPATDPRGQMLPA